MQDEMLKRIKELEDENRLLRQQVSTNDKVRVPLGQIPVPATQHHSMHIDDSLLYYLKSILGYTVKYQDNKITLRSVYAFCREDIFEIEVQDNKLMLKSTDYLLEWEEQFKVYIKNGKSYSAFFAAVTLELYNRQTFGQ